MYAKTALVKIEKGLYYLHVQEVHDTVTFDLLIAILQMKEGLKCYH